MKKQVSKMTDKELDDFFKKLSSEPDIHYVPQDWVNFEKKLTDNKGGHLLNGARWTLFGSLVLVGFLLAVWMTVTNSQIQPTIGSDIQMEASSFKTETDDIKNKVKPPDLPIASIEISEKNKVQIVVDSSTKYNQTKLNLALRRTSEKVKKHQIPPLNWNSDSKWKVFDALNRQMEWGKNLKIVGKSLIHVQNETKLIRKNKIALFLMASPDFSAVQFNHIPSSGRNFGASLEYFFDESWSVSLGVIHDLKTYRQGEGYWEGYNKAHKSLVGDCWIIEVPLNFKYYPIKKLKNNWFISSGLSSYFMLKEKYSLFYEYKNGKAYSEDIVINGNNQHVFGIWNFGFGYEQKVGKKFAIQAEPYFRLPLVGIGQGDLDLKSMGIFFGIKYYPSNHTNKF
ncbi:hypothetical protein [Cyclobacterium amurskyense]|uniref:hypothetical protein n=1 Tax=Cyclobacterium amurskyense TaxID=320787 RepID=UPI0030D8E6AD|tara:strand:- start:2985 stop:4172 length:1188 start_codon:yes stop_codon:yes gene_type:complete